MYIEIVKDVEKNGEDWIELVVENAQLQENCLSRALLVAVKCDNSSNVGALVSNGATNITEALQLAVKESKHSARAMLLLITAAMMNDSELVRRLFEESASDDGFQEVQKAGRNVSTMIPLEIASSRQNNKAVEELLLRTGVSQSEGSVYWRGLLLNVVEGTLLSKIHWVKTLHLGGNNLKILPSSINLHLQHVGHVFTLFLQN